MSTLYGEPFIMTVDGQPIHLRETHDFSWLHAFGHVFRVLQGTTSGCIGFGVEKDGQRFYLRHAGALPFGFFGDPEQAIDDLRASLALYQCVQHPAINPVLSQHEVPGGFVQAFPWLEGFVLSSDEDYARFRAFPLVQRLAWYDTLVDALAACEQQGIIPLGLSDTHLIIHDQNRHIALTTIHRFRQLPTTSAPARTPGMPWYRAPECQQEVALDETTAVFTAGALAYTFLGDRVHRNPQPWEGSPQMLSLASTATHPLREQRQQSVASFQQAWRQAVRAFDLPNTITGR